MGINTSLLKCYKPVNATDPASDGYGGDIDLTAEMTSDVINNEFDDVSSAERVSGLIDYRKQFLRNENADTWENIKVYISPNTPATMDIIEICQAGTLSVLGATVLLGTATYESATVLVFESDVTYAVSPGEWVYSVMNDSAISAAATVASVSGFNVTLSASFGSSTTGEDVIGVCPATMFSYSAPSSIGDGLLVGSVASNQCRGVWKRRTVDADATGQSNNSFTTVWES